MSEQLYINVDSILIDMGDHNVRYKRGDSVAGIPAGALESLIRMGKAVPRSEVEPAFDERISEGDISMAEDPQLVPDAVASDADPEPDWQSTPITALGLSVPIVKALEKAGLQSVRDVIEYGVNDPEHTLTSIPKIGKSAEEKIKAAIEEIAG